MRNSVIALVVVVIVGVAAVLGWRAWQNTRQANVSGDEQTTSQSTAVSQADPAANREQDGDPAPAAEASDEEIDAETGAAASLQSRIRFVYLWNNRLGMWHGGDDHTLAIADSSHPPQISYDGRFIAFVRDGGLWVMSGDGNQERLLVSEGEIEVMGTGETPARIHRFDWLPASHELLFNTALNVEMGLVFTNDLHRVDVDSLELVELLPPGQGGEFYAAPNGRHIAVVAPDQIRFVDLEGAAQRAPFAYSPVMTYSSFAYYPQPVWAEDSSHIAVVIPHPESFMLPEEPASVWTVPVGDGDPALVGQLQAGIPSFWIDPTLARVAYMQMIPPAQENVPPGYAVLIAGLDGDDAAVYFEGEAQFVGWSPTGTHFMVATPGVAETLHIGAVDTHDLTPVAGLHYALTHQVVWLDDGHYLAVGIDAADTDVALGALDGALAPLLTLEAGSFRLDVPSMDKFE